MRTTTIDNRLAELQRARAARKDADDLPGSMTGRERNAYLAETVTLDQRIAAIQSTAATLASLPTLDADIRWLAHLSTWRQKLCDDLLLIKSPIRDRDLKEQADRLSWSIRLIDFGFGIAKSLPIVTLEFSPIGVLMQAADYEIQGEALRGPRGWRGSLVEVDARLNSLAAQRAKAQAALSAVLMDDAERSEADADGQAHRDVLNTMDIRGNTSGTGLVAFTKDGDPLPISDMTDAQREAFAWFEAVAYPHEPVAS